MKADDKVSYEENGEEKGEKYTEFELLKLKVAVLQEQIELIGEIFLQENIALKEKRGVSTDLWYQIDEKLENMRT